MNALIEPNGIWGQRWNTNMEWAFSTRPSRLPMRSLISSSGVNQPVSSQVLRSLPIKSTWEGSAVNLRRGDETGRAVKFESWAGPQLSAQLQNAVVQIIDTPCSVLSNIRIVPAIRGLLQSSYRLGPDVNADIVQAGGHGYLEQQTATNLGYSRRLEEKLSELLKQVNGVGLPSRAIAS